MNAKNQIPRSARDDNNYSKIGDERTRPQMALSRGPLGLRSRSCLPRRFSGERRQ